MLTRLVLALLAAATLLVSGVLVNTYGFPIQLQNVYASQSRLRPTVPAQQSTVGKGVIALSDWQDASAAQKTAIVHSYIAAIATTVNLEFEHQDIEQMSSKIVECMNHKTSTWEFRVSTPVDLMFEACIAELAEGVY